MSVPGLPKQRLSQLLACLSSRIQVVSCAAAMPELNTSHMMRAGNATHHVDPW